MQPKMLNILELLILVLPSDLPYLNNLSKIVKGIYSISTGGITQKNISRQTQSDGLSLRSVQRFFATLINWELLYLSCISYFFGCGNQKTYLLAIDEVVEKKSGKATPKVGWFYSSIVGKAIKSICFHVVSLVEVDTRKSLVVNYEQREQKKSSKSKRGNKNNKKGNGKVGRPKGSKNKTHIKEHTSLSLSFERLIIAALALLATIGIVPTCVVGDGAYASKTYLLICIEQQIAFISKLRNNSALYLPYDGKKRQYGRKRKFGKKVNYDKLSPKSEFYYKTIANEENDKIKIEVYHFPQIWTKFLPFQINVVILMARNIETQKVARRVLFSTDLSFTPELIIEYYSLRFQIEFNFRDAKQYFGLADFRAYKTTQVDNSVGLAFFMVNFSKIVRKKVIELWQITNLSILDIKAGFRAEVQLQRLIKLLDLDPITIKSQVDIKQLAAFEAINLN